MFFYRMYKAASAETRVNQLGTTALHAAWKAAVFRNCSLIIAGCQKLSVTTNNVKSPKNLSTVKKKKKREKETPNVHIGDTLNKNCIYTPSEFRIQRNASSQCTKSCYYGHRNTRQQGLGKSLGWKLKSLTPRIVSIGNPPQRSPWSPNCNTKDHFRDNLTYLSKLSSQVHWILERWNISKDAQVGLGQSQSPNRRPVPKVGGLPPPGSLLGFIRKLPRGCRPYPVCYVIREQN